MFEIVILTANARLARFVGDLSQIAQKLTEISANLRVIGEPGYIHFLR